MFSQGRLQPADRHPRGHFTAIIQESVDQIEACLAGPSARRLRSVSSLDSLLRRGVERLPDDPSPAHLLQARYAVVPFYEPGRQDELEDLLTWCQSESAVAVRLITGPGGAGKTRLLIEHGLRLDEHGWVSGFLGPDAKPETLQDIERTSVPHAYRSGLRRNAGRTRQGTSTDV